MIKTITLTGDEVEVSGLTGTHAHLRNDGTSTIYAAKTAGITPGADGVGSVQAGKAYTLRGISGTIFLLGTGSVHIQSDDIADSPFESSAASGGSGADEVARAAIEAHEADMEIHVTAVDKARWNGISNPNLLINPDFRINQRGQSEYSISSYGYTVDDWRQFASKATLNDGFITLEATDQSKVGAFRQFIENSSSLAGKTVTLSVDWDLLTEGTKCTMQLKCNNQWSDMIEFTELGRRVDSITVDIPAELSSNIEFALMIQPSGVDGVFGKINLYSAKLEIGGHATPFIPPDPATELAKCQRYLLKINAFEAFRAVYVLPDYVDFSIPTPVSMRAGAISITGDFNIYPFPIAAPVTGFTPVIQVYGQNQLRLRATKTAHGLTDAVLTIPDSKFLLLSNEL